MPTKQSGLVEVKYIGINPTVVNLRDNGGNLKVEPGEVFEATKSQARRFCVTMPTLFEPVGDWAGKWTEEEKEEIARHLESRKERKARIAKAEKARKDQEKVDKKSPRGKNPKEK